MKNLIVYLKEPKQKYRALSSLRNFTYAPTLMYASLIPHDKFDRLKEWANEFENLCKEKDISIQIRSSNGKQFRKVEYQVN